MRPSFHKPKARKDMSAMTAKRGSSPQLVPTDESSPAITEAFSQRVRDYRDGFSIRMSPR